jgi:hypothetical protein
MNRNRRWAGGVGTAVSAAFAATLIGLANTPAASADGPDPFSWIGGMDLGDLSVPAQTTTSNIAISVDGFSLLQEGNATAISGPLDIAIATGNGASAQTLVTGPGGTVPSFFNFAFADGASSDANSGAGSFDSAFAVGTNSFAVAGLGFLDSAIADGTNSTAHAGGMLPVCVGLECTGGGLGSFDLAAAFSDMLHATATGGNFLTDIAP